MKQIVANYSYSPTTNVVTLTGVNIDADQLLLIVAPEAGRTMYSFASGVTGTVSAGTNTRVTLNASTAGLTASSPLVIFYDDQATVQSVTGTVGLDPASLSALENVTVTIGSSVTVSGTVTANIGSVLGLNEIYLADWDSDIRFSSSYPFPIYGTVTANVFGYDSQNEENLRIGLISYGSGPQARGAVEVIGADANPLPISGTVTANVGFAGIYDDGGDCIKVNLSAYDGTGNPQGINNTNGLPVAVVGGAVTIGSCVTHGVTIANSSVTVNGTFWQATQPVSLASVPTHGVTLQSTTVTVSSLPSISGTVTANISSTTVTVSALPSGALTTRFGSVTTANTAQLTAAVTNSSRKFLLVQNIATSTVTIGIGFAPTTTQGIQLAAGAGLTFDAFCPTGGVWWLSGTTGANWSVLEG